MVLKCIEGPMDGAVYVLSRNTSEPGERSTSRKPDGLWFDGQDEHGRHVQHQYKFDRNSEHGTHLALAYKYDGPVVDTLNSRSISDGMGELDQPNAATGRRISGEMEGIMDLAEQIARDLMTDGMGEKADHLKLFQNGRDLGGWSLEGLTGRIRKHLNGNIKTETPKPSKPNRKRGVK